MQPVIYEVAPMGAGSLSIMAMPESGEQIDAQFVRLQQLGIDHVVSLLEVDEQSEVGLADEEALCLKNSMRYTSFPITDRDVPERAGAVDLTTSLHRDINHGEHVVIHCRAGVGRTGVIASAVLMQAGYSASEAIHMVSWARGGLIPDTEEQKTWIESLEQ